MAQYNRHMNARLYQAAAELNDQDLAEDRGAFFRSVIGTLNHLVVGDILWFKRFAAHFADNKHLDIFRSLEKPTSLAATINDDLSGLAKLRRTLDESIIHFVESLTDTALADSVAYVDTKSVEHKKHFSALLQNIFNHQTHHRGQASTLLSQFGIDLGVTDLLEIIPEV